MDEGWQNEGRVKAISMTGCPMKHRKEVQSVFPLSRTCMLASGKRVLYETAMKRTMWKLAEPERLNPSCAEAGKPEMAHAWKGE